MMAQSVGVNSQNRNIVGNIERTTIYEEGDTQGKDKEQARSEQLSGHIKHRNSWQVDRK